MNPDRIRISHPFIVKDAQGNQKEEKCISFQYEIPVAYNLMFRIPTTIDVYEEGKSRLIEFVEKVEAFIDSIKDTP